MNETPERLKRLLSCGLANESSIGGIYGIMGIAVLYDPELTPLDKLVYIALRIFAMRKGVADPGHEIIAVILGVKRPSVVASIARLKARGWISPEPRPGFTSRYTFTAAKWWVELRATNIRDEGCQAPVTGGVSLGRQGVSAQHDTKNRNKNRNKNKPDANAPAGETDVQKLINEYAGLRGMDRKLLYSGKNVKVSATILRNMGAYGVRDIPGWVRTFLSLPDKYPAATKDLVTFARGDVADVIYKARDWTEPATGGYRGYVGPNMTAGEMQNYDVWMEANK